MKKLFIALLFAVATCVHANETFKIIVPGAAGGLQHKIALMLQQAIQTENPQITVVVIPRPGGDGAVALNDVVNDPADGVFIITGQSILYKSTQVPAMMTSMKKLKPTILMFETYFVFITPQESPIKTYRDLLQARQQGWVNFGNSLQISSFVASSILQDLTNITMVVYNSDPQVMQALKSKTVDVGVIAYPSVAGRTDYNVLIASNPAGLRRAQVRTNKSLTTQHGLWAGPATSDDNVLRMNRLIRSVLENPRWQQTINSWSLDIYTQDRTPQGLVDAADRFLENVKK